MIDFKSCSFCNRKYRIISTGINMTTALCTFNQDHYVGLDVNIDKNNYNDVAFKNLIYLSVRFAGGDFIWEQQKCLYKKMEIPFSNLELLCEDDYFKLLTKLDKLILFL